MSLLPGLDALLLPNALTGRPILPTDSDYDTVRKDTWNLDLDAKPAAIVCVGPGTADVQKVVQLAVKHGWELTIAGGRHTARCYKDGAVAIDFRDRRQVSVDPEKRLVTCEAGVLNGELEHATAPYHLAVPGAGHDPSTGIAGLTLGGGHGFLSRLGGMAVDNLERVELVTADGTCLICSDNENSDLFWAVKGAGHNFGVVTSFTYRLTTVPPILAGPVSYRLPSSISPLLALFGRRFAENGPSTPADSTKLIIRRTFTVEPEKGGFLTNLWAAYIGDSEKAEKEMAWRREVPGYDSDAFGPMSYLDLQHATGVPPSYAYERGVYLSEITPELAALLAEHIKASKGSIAVLLQAMGGRISELGGTAFVQRSPYAIWLVITSALRDPRWTREEAILWVRRCSEICEPWSLGRVANDTIQEGTGDGGDVWGANAIRVRKLKTAWDPKNVWRNNRNVAPLEEQAAL